MSEFVDTSAQPLSFEAESSKKTRLDATAFRGRVPVVLAFVEGLGPATDAAIRSLDASLILFGERRVQLLVVVDANPAEVAERLGATVPLITEPGLAAELNAEVDDQGRLCTVIVGNDGRVLDTVRQLPQEDQASAVLVAIDRLSAEIPDRFVVLPHTDANAELIDDPTGAMDDTTNDQARASFRQRLSWLTGDRTEEAKALAQTVAASAAPDETVLTAAKQAVKEAHGDSFVDESTPVSSDVATPDDVIEKL